MQERVYITDVNKIESIRCDAESREISLIKGYGENWSVYVSDNTMLTKLKRLMMRAPEGSVKCWVAGKNSNGQPTGYFFELAPKCVAFTLGTKTRNIELTAAQKAERKAKRKIRSA